MGIGHRVFLIWGMSITVLGYRRISGLETWVATEATALRVVLGEPVEALSPQPPPEGLLAGLPRGNHIWG